MLAPAQQSGHYTRHYSSLFFFPELSALRPLSLSWGHGHQQRDTGGCKRDQLCKYLHKYFKSDGIAEENSEIEGMDTENADQTENANSAQILSQNATLNQQK